MTSSSFGLSIWCPALVFPENVPDWIPPESPLELDNWSRFFDFPFKPHTLDEFKEIVTCVLVRREGKSEELAGYMADGLSNVTRDPRLAEQVARLCDTTDEADELIKDMRRRQR